MRARMALAQAGQVVQLREVALRAKPQALLDVSPAATVPVLVLPDQVLTQQPGHHGLGLARQRPGRRPRSRP